MKPKTVAVYCIIKNNKRLYQMAYPAYSNYNSKYTHIIIYDIISNKIDNLIHCYRDSSIIIKLKHYYNSFTKRHFLLGIKPMFVPYGISPLQIIYKRFYI